MSLINQFETAGELNYFEPTRLILVRQLRGYSRKHMREALGISSGEYRGYEKRDYSQLPDKAMVQRISFVLSWPVKFFYGDEIELIGPDVINGWVSGSRFLEEQIDDDLKRIRAKIGAPP